MLTSKCAFLFLLPFIYPSTILDQVNVLVDRAYATHHIYTQEDLDIAMAMGKSGLDSSQYECFKINKLAL